MKKFLIATLMSLLGMTQVVAQEYEYVPFVREGVKWVCFYMNSNNESLPLGQVFFTLEFKGDTEIGGKMYKALHKYSGEDIDSGDDVIPIYMREENKVVYGIVPDGKTYDDCLINGFGEEGIADKVAAGEEFILYDFNDAVAFIKDRLILPPYVERKVITDEVGLYGRQAMRYIFHSNTRDYCIIEGIGYDGLSDGYPLGVHSSGGIRFQLSHVIENGKDVYRSEHYKQTSELKPMLPIVCEGVKWVNEKVIINHGDTTRYYYTYEFSGSGERDHSVCYQYTGEDLNEGMPTVAAMFQQPYNDAEYCYSVTVHDNPALSETINAGNCFMDCSTALSGYWSIYQFSVDDTEISYINTVNYCIYNQLGEILNRQNFIEVEPLEIDGYLCRRYAHVDTDGSPIFYVIEGIGFDSRDMGDLLTPFTLPPAPDADYQEWCGLSHVIKDGEIIYKGMCYREPQLAGDVNGDGNVNMDDLTDLINILLNNTSMNASSDINGDDTIGMDDLTDLINILLTQ